MKRLRVFDLHTPWFWLTWLYYGRRYGKCTWEITYWPPSKHFRWALDIWQWEPVPDERSQTAIKHSSPFIDGTMPQYFGLKRREIDLLEGKKQ